VSLRLSTVERQKQIIDEAIKIIHEKGFASLSIRELAKKVGISEPAIYRHFSSKEDIVVGILNRMIEFGEIIENNIKDIKNPKEKIKQFIYLHIELLEKNPQMTSIIFSEDIFQPNEIINGKLQIIFRKRHSLLNGIINNAIDEGIIVDIEAEEIGNIILGYLHLVIREWRQSRFNFSLIDKATKLVNLLEQIVFI